MTNSPALVQVINIVVKISIVMISKIAIARYFKLFVTVVFSFEHNKTKIVNVEIIYNASATIIKTTKLGHII